MITVLKETPFDPVLNKDLLERWADGIPRYSDNDPNNPEWKPTPIRILNLSGLEILVKDESVNPTGTHKARMAWEVGPCLYRDLAQRRILQGKCNGPVPRLSTISAGNTARALSYWAEKFGLPPPKILIGSHTSQQEIASLMQAYADVYAYDLNETALGPEEILHLTNNANGIDLTSVTSIEPHAIFYDWLAFEILNSGANTVYCPCGSGRLVENILTWMYRCQHASIPDPRLQIPIKQLSQITIKAAEPKELTSKADKLASKFKPFLMFKAPDIAALVNLDIAGQGTGVYHVEEEYIDEAYRIFQQNKIVGEPSAAAGLALYLQDKAEGRVVQEPVLVVNTGKGT